MIPLIELLYNHAMDDWHGTCRFLSGEEALQYRYHSSFMEKQESELLSGLSEGGRERFEACLKSREEIEAADRRLYFARGLSMGLALGFLGAGE